MTVQKNEKNPEEFWKLLEKMNTKRTDKLLNLQHSFFNRFKNLLASNAPNDMNPDNNTKTMYS